jgi:nucleotide-binding universal stress UspA family protein
MKKNFSSALTLRNLGVNNTAMIPLRILIAVNFTHSSDKAISFAVQLLHTLHCHIRLIYCYSDFIEREEFAKLKLNIKTASLGVRDVFAQKMELQQMSIQQQWASHAPHEELTLSTMSVKGDVDTMIGLESESWQPHLIVAGSSVEKNSFTELMESTASDIIEKTTYPVLVIPKNLATTGEQIDKIMFLTNFKSEEYTSLHRLIEMLPGKGRILHCIRYIHDRPDQWDHMRLEALREYISHTYPNQNIACETLTGDHQLETLNQYIKDHQIGLLAVTRRRRKAIFKFLHPDISHKLLHHSQMPLLVFNE